MTSTLERDSKKIRKQLSIALRSVQWSYGIFWSPPKKQNRKLEWGDGYYNGEIKTRKNLPPADVLADTLGFGRSVLLRKLYDSIQKMSEACSSKEKESKPYVLSEDELSDLEKYYLRSMSYTFEVGKCSHGKALEADHKPVWHWIAQDAGRKWNQKEKKDAGSKVFSSSSEAKKASVTSVKTVICFQHEGGVLELGVTDLVEKDSDPDLIQHIKRCLHLFDSKDNKYGRRARKEQLDAVGQKPKAPDSDENLKVDKILEKEVHEIMNKIKVTFPNLGDKRFQIVVKFPEMDRLLKKIRDEICSLKDYLVNPRCNKAGDGTVPGTQEVTIEAGGFHGSKSELEKGINQAVWKAVREAICANANHN